MEAHLADMESSGGPTSSLAGTSRNTHVEDDDVVFIESVQPPICAPAIPNERNFVFASSKHENPPGTDSTISPSWRDLTSQKGNLCETIVIDDEGDTDTNGGEEKNPTDFIEWGPNGNKSSTKNVDFPIASLSRSKTKTAVGPFNPGRIDVTDAFQNGRFAVHHNPDSWISQSASFPRNQKQQGVDSLSPVASLPKQIFQPSNQQPTKPVKVTCANCKKPLQKGQTAYQRKGSAHLFCSTTCLSSFSHKRTRKTRNVMCKKDSPVRTTTIVPPVESSKSLQGFYNASLSPYENCQSLRKEVFTKSRCIICNKLGEVRHEISVNSITHKLCSNNCFNEYRLTNGLIMNCCEQCSKYMPKSTGHSILITGQQKRFCCQNCADEYKEIMEAKSKLLLLQNRKRNAIREENEKRLRESSGTLSGNTGDIPEKKEKSSEIIKVAADCSLDTSSEEQNVNLPCSVAVISDTFKEQLGDKNSEELDMSILPSLDPGSWPRILNMKQREFLVKNNPPQIRNFNFPKDSAGKKFSETYYTRILPNGEKGTRPWLLYSASKDSVFCLYCRLFGEGKNQLRNENGCKDWHHLSHLLSKHDESEMHINNSVKYSKLKSDLENKTNEATEGGEDCVQLLYT
ncbi:zinc finger MYM-type protein 5 isoform X1 [Mus musculus]|uniref:Zinc finger MYM-type protein 5 n=2 Tax=Mus musculus TaxID=10090 RepID=ZMYM5_MOUSE|nr:zinc finger MYM-type protein 5 [Mus musculus]NP_001240682.1 zinc finger MYM-type protein 5 [Mus musculus]NP_659091.3 zinc finger MYM-type protein 5 [Mus musculus]XP_006518915.2 zinc finger MYM-type protein 5 isoform X1 [Mus musculus]XP_006518920.1 zinc finger MYM-type protein 5 isoform X1 [Mus musculus]XP_011243324.1 zinc finger MYM-type protein 5 isoform X1 [Mus musculus]XP_017171456.1 zinc finger MYM-type protein 5 isoform X1 [Mus musculus]XP_030103619.1 zinc finger MYM-type protein 5 i|eukprot:NP_001240681.1 zinc finger MYM-type protein 5 [Mus musculus]